MCYCSSVVGQSKTTGQFPKLGDLLITFRVIKLVTYYSFAALLLLWSIKLLWDASLVCVFQNQSLLFVLFCFPQYAFDHSKARNEGVILPKPGAVTLLAYCAIGMARVIGMQYVQRVRNLNYGPVGPNLLWIFLIHVCTQPMKTEIVSKMVKIVLITISFTTGVDPDYDQALADIQKTRTWFDQYLKKQCAALGCKVSVQVIALYPLPLPTTRQGQDWKRYSLHRRPYISFCVCSENLVVPVH